MNDVELRARGPRRIVEPLAQVRVQRSVQENLGVLKRLLEETAP